MAVQADENKRSPLKAWVRALERTAPIGRDRSLTLPALIGQLAERFSGYVRRYDVAPEPASR